MDGIDPRQRRRVGGGVWVAAKLTESSAVSEASKTSVSFLNQLRHMEYRPISSTFSFVVIFVAVREKGSGASARNLCGSVSDTTRLAPGRRTHLAVREDDTRLPRGRDRRLRLHRHAVVGVLVVDALPRRCGRLRTLLLVRRRGRPLPVLLVPASRPEEELSEVSGRRS